MSSLYKKSSPSEPQLPADGPSETSVTRGFGCGGAAMTWLDHVEGHGDHGMCHPKTYSQHHIFGEHDMDKNIHESIYVYIYYIQRFGMNGRVLYQSFGPSPSSFFSRG